MNRMPECQHVSCALSVCFSKDRAAGKGQYDSFATGGSSHSRTAAIRSGPKAIQADEQPHGRTRRMSLSRPQEPFEVVLSGRVKVGFGERELRTGPGQERLVDQVAHNGHSMAQPTRWRSCIHAIAWAGLWPRRPIGKLRRSQCSVLARR